MFDKIIGETLTSQQRQTIQCIARQLAQQLAIDVNVVTHSIELEMLDKTKFQHCKADFQYKLNAIIKGARKGTWSPLFMREIAITKANDVLGQKRDDHIRELRAMDSEIKQITFLNKGCGDDSRLGRQIQALCAKRKELEQKITVIEKEIKQRSNSDGSAIDGVNNG